MKRFLAFVTILLVPFIALAQQHSIEIDEASFKPVHTDALTGVAIDKIEPDYSQRPCARIKMHINRMSREDINGISVKVIGGNAVVMKRLVAAEGTGLIIELTAKPEIRFYLHHDKYGDSNQVNLNLEGNTEYRINAQLNYMHTIVVSSNVANAEVYVDDAFKGRIGANFTLSINDIQPGKHKIKIQDGSLKNETSVDVNNQNVSFRLELNQAQARPQYAVFVVDPKEASITIDGKPLMLNAEGVASTILNSGSHEYVVSANDYYTEKGSLVIDGAKVVKNIKLRPAFGFLSVPANGDLAGAGVYIDNSLIGKTPINKYKVANGSHKVRIVKDMYKAIEGEVVVKEGEVTEFAPKLVADFAEVTLKTGTGFGIYVNNEFKGTTTWSGTLPTGTYIFEARKEGYNPTSLSQTISQTPPSQSYTIPTPTPIMGSLNINSDPIMSQVYIDGTLVGETPMMHDLTIGKHTVSITKAGYSKSVQEVTIAQGQTAELNVTLSKGMKLYYTSSDGKIVTPQEGVFDANIISNTYVNGQGVIEFDNSITKIADFGFKMCTTLTSITIPNSVTAIGFEAFYNCSSLKKIVIGNSVTSFGKYAFSGCNSLTDVTINNGVSEISDETFRGCASLTTIVIPNSVTKIGDKAFEGCSSLQSITMSNRVKLIGHNAFNGCNRLTSVHITDLSAWCKIAFSNGNANPLHKGARLYINGKEARNITIPSDVTRIRFATFYNCPSLTSVIIPENVTYISKSAFCDCSMLTTVTISNSVTSIGAYAFNGCKLLSTIVIPDSVTTIGKHTFDGCSSLASVTIGSNVKSFGDEVFAGCYNLSNVVIREGVTSIKKSLFSGLSSLTSVTIPNSVTGIEDSAFYGCSSLKSIVIPNGVTTIGEEAFRSCSSLASVTIGTGVTTIGAKAFYGCSSLTRVTIPDSVTTIGYIAFYNCTALTSVTIGIGVKEIKAWAFKDCTSLTSIYCKPSTPPRVDSYNHPFYYNASGRKIYVPAASLESYKNWGYSDEIVGYDF